LEYLGHGPEQVPLEPETYTQEDLGDVTRTLISYQVEDGCRVEAYLMLPKGDGPFPGIVVFHPTTNTTIEQPVGFGVVPQLQFGLNLARRGYATLSPRNYIWSYRDITASKWSEYARTAGFLLDTWPNWTGMGKMLWDGMRAVDYLLAVPGVDGARLGCIGHSLGAKEVLYAMAFDERLKAAGLTYEALTTFAGPRRLTLVVEGLPTATPVMPTNPTTSPGSTCCPASMVVADRWA